MSELSSTRSGALLPTAPKDPPAAWAEMNGRRLLPSPGPKKVKIHRIIFGVIISLYLSFPGVCGI